MNIGLGTKLRTLLVLLDGGLQDIYDELGVPFRPRFYAVVHLLLEVESATVNAVAQSTGVSQPAATQTINEMKRLGLVEPFQAGDRRARPVRLTDKGRQLSARLEPIWLATHRAAAGLDGELPESLAAIIDGAVSALARHGFRERIREELGRQI